MLALQLGGMTVEELEQRMSASEISRWAAFHQARALQGQIEERRAARAAPGSARRRR